MYRLQGFALDDITEQDQDQGQVLQKLREEGVFADIQFQQLCVNMKQYACQPGLRSLIHVGDRVGYADGIGKAELSQAFPS